MPSKSKTLMPLAIHNEGEHPLKLVKSYIEWIQRNRVYNKLYRVNKLFIQNRETIQVHKDPKETRKSSSIKTNNSRHRLQGSLGTPLGAFPPTELFSSSELSLSDGRLVFVSLPIMLMRAMVALGGLYEGSTFSFCALFSKDSTDCKSRSRLNRSRIYRRMGSRYRCVDSICRAR